MAASKSSSKSSSSKTAASLSSSQRTAAVEKARAENIAATGTSTQRAPSGSSSSSERTAQDMTSAERTAAVEKARARNIAGTGKSTQYSPTGVPKTTSTITAQPTSVPATEPYHIKNPTELKQLTDAGLTEADITRSGDNIYLKPGVTPETYTGKTATAFDASKAGQKILNVDELNKYAKQGLTEADIVRNGKDIYFKGGVTPETLLARTAGDVQFGATPPATGENLSPDVLETPTDTSMLTGWDLDTSSPTAFANSINKLFDYFKSDAQKLLEEKQNAATAKLEGFVDELGNQKPRFDELNAKYNVDSQYQQLMELNMLMAQKQGEYMQLSVDTEGQTISTGLLIGQGAAVQRQMAADMGILGARAAALTGNIELANTLIDRSLDVEFGAIKDQITATENLLGVYGDQLSAEESKQAEKVGLVLDERKTILEAQKEEKKQKLQLMLDVAANGGEVSVIDMEKSLEENIRAAAPYLETSATEGAATEAQILSAAQTLVNSGLADNMNDAIAQVRAGLAGDKYSGGDSTGVTGTAAWTDWVANTGTGTVTSEPQDQMWYGEHHGYDIDGHTGDDVVAPVSGTVTEVVNDQGSSEDGYGNYIKVQDDAGNTWTFAHFSNATVTKGQNIAVGDYMGAMGRSGNTNGNGSTDPDKGSHLHVEVQDANGAQLNPKELLTGEMQQDETLKAYQDAFSNIELDLTDTDTKIARREFNKRLQNGDYEGAKQYMKSVIATGSGQTTKDKLIARASTADALATIKTNLADFVKAGGDTGILAGTQENIAKAIGKTTDPKLRALATSINYAIINYRSFVSGAAFTASESKAYEDLFPSIGNVPEVNNAVIDQLISSFDASTASYYKLRMGEDNYSKIFTDSDFSVADNLPASDTETDTATDSYVEDSLATDNAATGIWGSFLNLFK